MARQPCRDCGSQVSTDAEVCPQCGVRSPTASDPLLALGRRGKQKHRGLAAHWVRWVIVFFIGLLIIWVSYEPPKERVTSKGEKIALDIRANGRSVGVCKNKPQNEFYYYGNQYWFVSKGQVGGPHPEWYALEITDVGGPGPDYSLWCKP